MPLPADLPVVDHHCHLSPSGDGVRAAERFAREGGTDLFLTTHNWNHAPLRAVEDYRRQFEEMEALAGRIRTGTPVRVHLVVAPYPVDLVETADALGLPAAVAVQEGALELAGRWVRDRRAVAIGEVGRPHFPVAPDRAAAAETVFRRALAVARESDCPAVVHCEDLDARGYRGVADLARTVGQPAGKVVKHYAREVVPTAGRAGIVPSFLARRDLVETVLDDPAPWFLETDFLDDPARPGAVMDLATVPRRASALVRDHPDLVDRLRTPFVESVRRVYGFDPTDGKERSG